MPRAAWGVLVVTMSACSAGAAPVHRVATAAEVTAIWDVERADAASRDVALTFMAAACSAVRTVDVKETADRVVITLGAGTSAGRECTDPLLRHRTVRLGAPLGDRDLYDGGAAPPVLVRQGG